MTTRISLLTICLILAGTVSIFAQQPVLPYLDPDLPTDQRVDDLISRMTLEEKANQMVDAAEELTRLNVPRYGWWSEALHGVARAGKATIFPQAIVMGATFRIPIQSLKGICKVSLAPGASQNITFAITPEMMSSVDDSGKSLVSKGDIQLTIGGDSPGQRSLALGAASFLKGTFSIK